ncbi:hypothetical protein [Noviherbaspirillum malthae]|uniref:hypothetical protein n=1 Tax=Noviherbaspirillum malthae TaxID=1260987 RepID=UPI00188F9C56|nr:hypothetical protein [Noviherbaspirillum malthae]
MSAGGMRAKLRYMFGECIGHPVERLNISHFHDIQAILHTFNIPAMAIKLDRPAGSNCNRVIHACATTMGVPDTSHVAAPGHAVYVIVGTNVEPEEIVRMLTDAEVWPSAPLPSHQAHQMSPDAFKELVREAFKDQPPPMAQYQYGLF